MGKGGQTKSSSQSFSGSGQAWAQPYAQGAAGGVQSVFNQNQPGLQNMTNMVQNDLNPALMQKFQSGLPVAQQGTQYNSDVLSGKYLNGNPHLQQMIDLSAGDIRENVNARMSQAGRYASGAHDGVMADSIGQMSAGMRYQNYGDEMNRMGQAAQAAQGQVQGDNAQLLASLGLGAELPYTGSNNLANSLGALFNGGTDKSKSKTNGPGVLGYMAGIASSAASAGAAACDVRLKENVTLNHVDPDGLAFYDFTYKPGLGLPEGVQTNLPMAQDVATLRPWAMGPELDGFLTIYPAKL
jgi:hypothetical protein